MAPANPSRRRSSLGLWGETALELIKRRGLFDPARSATGPEPERGSARASVMAAAVWEFHEEREPRAKTSSEPRLRSLKGQTPVTEEPLIPVLIERLRAIPPARWSRHVRLHHYEYRGAAVARGFLTEARKALPADPGESAAWARLVYQAVGVDRLHYCADDREQIALQLRALLYVANTHRCHGDVESAERQLQALEAEALRLGVTQPEFWAELASFRASLYRAIREFHRAIEQAELTAALCSRGRDRQGDVRARWLMASIYEQLGEPREALAALRPITAEVERLPDHRLAFAVRHSEASYLARCGSFLEAHLVYRALETEYPLYPDYEPFRLWLVGLIRHGLGPAHEAEEAFRASRCHLLNDRNAYDAALVTLDWSLFLLGQNRPEEVLPLAVSMGQAFEALGVARETLASWAIFQAAAERRELTRAVAESMVRTLGEERVGPKPGR